jgi:transposase-like protein
MAQRFLLSAKARTLSLARVMRLSDAEAYAVFREVRWPQTEGKPICPRCGSVEAYEYTTRRIFKCKGCGAQFSVTTGTIFASRKLSYRDVLGAIAIFVNGAKGVSALQISRDLDCQYKTAYVLCHKLREALGAEMAQEKVGGTVEIDGAYFGGYSKPANYEAHRVDRRLKENQTGKRKAVVVMRERGGRTFAQAFKSEGAALSTVHARVMNGSTVHADEASVWDDLHARFDTKRINHSVAFKDEGACTNQAESFFSRLRRAEVGTHHHISGPYLTAYAREMAWREDHRRMNNGDQFLAAVGAALAHPVSENWKGYWQRKAA